MYFIGHRDFSMHFWPSHLYGVPIQLPHNEVNQCSHNVCFPMFNSKVITNYNYNRFLPKTTHSNEIKDLNHSGIYLKHPQEKPIIWLTGLIMSPSEMAPSGSYISAKNKNYCERPLQTKIVWAYSSNRFVALEQCHAFTSQCFCIIFDVLVDNRNHLLKVDYKRGLAS